MQKVILLEENIEVGTKLLKSGRVLLTEKSTHVLFKSFHVRGKYQLKIAPVSSSSYYVEEISIGMKNVEIALRENILKGCICTQTSKCYSCVREIQTQKILDNAKHPWSH